MSQRLPPIAYVLGLGGVVPFVACGIASTAAGQSAGLGLPALLGYGAVILSFLGAVQWGFALAPHGPDMPILRPSLTLRLLLGVLPSLIGWAALLLGLAGLPEIGLVLLIAGFVATVLIEAGWSRLGIVPSGYMTLRWILSILVVMTLVTVLALRLLGASIVF